jgi:hypothetical protein
MNHKHNLNNKINFFLLFSFYIYYNIEPKIKISTCQNFYKCCQNIFILLFLLLVLHVIICYYYLIKLYFQNLYIYISILHMNIVVYIFLK